MPGAKAIHSAFMLRSRFFRATLAFPVSAILFCAILLPMLSHASKKKELTAVRWTAGAPGCSFERGDDGRYRWTMTGKDLTVTLLVDSQELTKSRRRFYHLLGVYVAVTYTGQDKFEFPADLRIDFVRHHDVLEGFQDPTELSNKLQQRRYRDLPNRTSDQEESQDCRRKNGSLARVPEGRCQFIEFLSAQSLDPNTVMLTPGNPEAHGWAFFATSNKWIGPWKEREDFILGVWMKDRVWQFPFSLPPAQGDLILRKPPE